MKKTKNQKKPTKKPQKQLSIQNEGKNKVFKSVLQLKSIQATRVLCFFISLDIFDITGLLPKKKFS